MGGVFSKKNTSNAPVKNCEVTEQDQAILQLKSQRDKIKQFIKRKEKCLEKERQCAKQLLGEGKKDKALLLLKKKKYQENMIEQTVKQLDQIEKMAQDIEFAQVQQKVTDCLRQGNEALKKMNNLFDLDDIDKIMEETKEAAEYQQEISALISGQLTSVDVQEVEKELDELLANEIGDSMPEPVGTELPSVSKEEAEKEKPVRERVALEA